MRTGKFVDPLDKMLQVEVMTVCRISVYKFKKGRIAFFVFFFKQFIQHLIAEQLAFRLIGDPESRIDIDQIVIFADDLKTE